MRYAIFIFTLFVSLLFLCPQTFSEPEKLSDDQMTDVNVQKGIRPLDNAEKKQAENELLEHLTVPVPGTALDPTNTNPIYDTTQVELDSLDNQPHQQNVQEQISEQLFDNVIDQSNPQ